MNTEEIAGLIRPLWEVERDHILDAMRLTDGNKPLAAKALGISLKGLYNKLNRYQAEVDAKAEMAQLIGGLR